MVLRMSSNLHSLAITKPSDIPILILKLLFLKMSAPIIIQLYTEIPNVINDKDLRESGKAEEF